jgi:phospholipase/lecithinase/hemolysin
LLLYGKISRLAYLPKTKGTKKENVMNKIQQVVACLTVLSASAVIADTGYSDMVVFGDSLSDPGNVFVVAGEVSVRPYDAGNIPDAPYPIGGLTFSNGKTWIEHVSANLKLKGGTGPALRTSTFSNYAFGGARAASSAGGPFDLSAQVGQYFADTGGSVDSEALYTVYIGGNDVRDALSAFNVALQQTLIAGGTVPEALAAGQAAAEVILTDAVTTIADNIIALASQGAGNFLVPNVPNLGLVPAITDLGPDAATLATQLSFSFNLALENTLSSIEAALSVDINRFDTFAFISSVVAAPDAFGLDNAVDACITPEVKKGAVCKHPEDYLFWDGIHPTRTGHNLLAEQALSILQ